MLGAGFVVEWLRIFRVLDFVMVLFKNDKDFFLEHIEALKGEMLDDFHDSGSESSDSVDRNNKSTSGFRFAEVENPVLDLFTPLSISLAG